MKGKNLFLVSILVMTIMIVVASYSAVSAKTLKIGQVNWLGYVPGISAQKTVKVLVKMTNDKGGLNVGGEKYQIELIHYNSENSQAKAQAAINRLIYEDKVKFIIGDSWVETWLPITEKNKAIVSAMSFIPPILLPKNRYAFQTGSNQTNADVLAGWFVKNYPQYKRYVVTLTDNQLGRIVAGVTSTKLKGYGLDVQQIFYPAGQQDLSAMGTKIRAVNPDVVVPFEMPAVKAIRQAGWKGQLFSTMTLAAESAAILAGGPEYVEGYIQGGYATEYEPALTELGKEFKVAYASEYGRWDHPELTGTAYFYALITAIQKAQSLDTDKVAEVFAGGMKFDYPGGSTQMISRPDFGNSRTIDSISTHYIKRIKGGQAELIAKLSIEEALEYWNNRPKPKRKGPPPEKKN